MQFRSFALAAVVTLASGGGSAIVAQTAPAPPPGFTALFNGKDLSGWRGRPGGGGVFSPYVEAKFTPEERDAKQKEWNADRDLHWRVDTAKGEIVSDGKGVHLATEKAAPDRRGWGQVAVPPQGRYFEGDVMRASLLVALVSLIVPAAQQPLSPDAEGFIRNWLVLAPIAIVGESGATEIDRDFLKGEAAIKPKADDKVTVGGTELTWKAHQTSDYFIDFLQSFGKERGEYVAGYAVAYVLADQDMKVTLALSTNDQGKAWLNGKEVFKFADTRVLDKDTDRVDVTLAKGQNVLVLKVINEVNNWQGCARFLQGGAPVKTLRISLAPQ